MSHNDIAWLLATHPGPSARDPKRAAELAQGAIDLAPKNSNYWNTLGVARYRAGDFEGSIAALQKFRELRTDDAEWGNPFFLAMAHWRSDHKDEARRWYDIGVDWMNKKPANGTDAMKRFRGEAAELLGVSEIR
ncbi:MAG TPA: hypothetical protein VFV66_25485 [Nonomuraea sp.]|nr:hypothetical protein [Nonomuraea sp.]